jgi:hypothetical protein
MPRRTILLALGGVVAIAAAWAWMGSDLPPFGEPPLPPEAVGPPPGRWHWIPAPPPAAGEPDLSPEERARLVSLPYSAGGRRAEAGAPGGVVRWDRERAAPGINLYVSGHGPEAVLIDMAGRELGRWRYPFARAFPGRAPTPDTAFFRRAALLPDGRLLALYQAGGLIELDRRSRLLSAYPGSFYNDFFAAPDGRVWTLSKQARPVAGAEPPAWVLEDFLVAIERDPSAAPGGSEWVETFRLSLLDVFAGTRFAPLIERRRPSGDVFHSNTVEIFDGSLARRSPLFAAGNALVSLREIDLVAIVDPAAGEVVWAERGPWRRQHQPTLLASGRILLFDNRGRGGFSRLLEVDPLAAPGSSIAWSWAPEPANAFSSPQAGSAERLANGDTLVTESERGRAFELTPDGEVVWELASPHRAGPDDRLVATLFEVVRYPEGYLEREGEPIAPGR